MDDFMDDVLEFLPSFSGEEAFNPWDEVQTPETGPNMVGYAEDSDLWREQSTPFTCAVVSQQMILERFGIEISEAQLVYDSVSNGWLTDSGTTMEDMGSLLEHYGVSTHQGMGGGIESMIYELAQGHKLIVAVDSGELWNEDIFIEDWLNPNGADHAIMINGIDASDPDNILVMVNDPGHPQGAGMAYPLDEFMDAWNDSGQFYMSTSEAPPGLEAMPVLGDNFNADTGWYFDQAFWGGILQSVLKGVTSGLTTYELTEDEGFANFTSFAVTAVSSFAFMVDYFDANQIDNTFYAI